MSATHPAAFRGIRVATSALGLILCLGTVALPGDKDSKEPTRPTDEGVVLDWGRSYWHYHLTLRAPRYSSPLEKKTGDAANYVSYERGWHITPMLGRVRSSDAPPDWVKPDFDDAHWPRERRPAAGSEGWSYDPVVQVKRLRGAFDVADPAKVTSLRLEIEYIGGVVVHLNGEEIARQHLPKGDLTADSLGEGYPREAYVEEKAKWGMGHEGNQERKPTAKALALRWRTLTVTPPAKLLRKGTNVLAVSLHQSGYHAYAATWSWTCGGMGGNVATWPHAAIRTLSLHASPNGAVTAQARPVGVQVWAEDVHRRVVNRDFGAADGPVPVVRLIGARNGTYSAQVVVGTSEPLKGVSARMSELVAVKGEGRIPAAAARVRYAVGTPLTQLRGRIDDSRYFNAPARRLLARYGSGNRKYDGYDAPSKEVLDLAAAIKVFDHLSEPAPANVPADSCQPIWVTVRVPKDAPAGEYTGTLTIEAGGTRKVPVRLRVFEVTLPEGGDYTSFVGLQHSLWGPVVHTKVKPWSAEHWQLVEKTMRHLGEVGNDLAILPLICEGEAGNPESLVPWVRKGDRYEHDWTNLDRYLELVAKHWGKRVAVVGEICWVPYTERGWVLKQSGVTVVDSDRKEKLVLPEPGSEKWAQLFLPFARAAEERVRAKGFESFQWGWFYDNVPEPLKAMASQLAKECPKAGWARSSHDGNTNRPFAKQTGARVSLDMHIRGFQDSFTKAGAAQSRQGWKRSGDVLFPRGASEVQAVGAWDSPMSMRWLVENCLVNGASGVGRLAADYWPPQGFANWYQPLVNHLLYPSKDGPEGSARFEAFREGVQEAELRILLERAGKDQQQPAKSVLDERVRLLWAVPAGPTYPLLGEYYAGWQERSWDLHAAAAGQASDMKERGRFFAKEK